MEKSCLHLLEGWYKIQEKCVYEVRKWQEETMIR